MSLSVDDMILYIENIEGSTEKLLELINQFSMIAGCRVDIYKNHLHLFLYTCNEIIQK